MSANAIDCAFKSTFNYVDYDVTVSVSGGIDSIVLAHYLKERFGIERLYHFNHNVQAANNEMEEAVRRFAREHSMYVMVRKASGPLKSEAECRHARLGAIFKKDYSNIVLATAHHLDDCVESYLLNTIRGHPEYMPIPWQTDFGNDNYIIHPFLRTSKKIIEQYACHHDLMKYVVSDPTNKITKGSRRNFIRNEVMPLMIREEVGLNTVVKKKFYSEKPDAIK